MTNFKVIFSIDPTGEKRDLSEIISIEELNTCLFCLHDKENRFHKEIQNKLIQKGYNKNTGFLQIMKIYTI